MFFVGRIFWLALTVGEYENFGEALAERRKGGLRRVFGRLRHMLAHSTE